VDLELKMIVLVVRDETKSRMRELCVHLNGCFIGFVFVIDFDVSVKIYVLCDVMSSVLVDKHQRFGGNSCLHHQGGCEELCFLRSDVL
jgi:hypothetical protein